MRPGDFGPIYTETDLAFFPVEPFNTASNLIFLVIIIYWYLKLKNKQIPESSRLLLKIGLPILTVGFIGGTVYHATRMHWVWLVMDFLPILVLGLTLSMFLWRRIMDSYVKIIISVLLLVGIPRAIVYYFFSLSNVAVSLNYMILTLPTVLAIIVFEARHQFKYSKWAAMSLLLIMTALLFRIVDSSQFVVTNFPIGTHWIWHLLGGAGSHFILLYYTKSAVLVKK